MSIITVDGFICDNFLFDKDKSKKVNEHYYLRYSNADDIKDNIHITFKDYKNDQNVFFSINDVKSKKDDEVIISLFNYLNKDETKVYTAQTGNFIGKFKYNKIDIDIKSRFSDTLLKRMLNFANGVYLDDVSVFDAQSKDSKSIDYSKFVIYYMFIQKLEKAFLLGLPKSYISVKHHEMKLKGKIDINRFIKHDIPFKGKVSSVSREQKEIQEIIDVLYKAITIIEKDKSSFSTKNISHIKTHLKQYKSSKYVSNETISKALKSKALKNPIFSPYKKVLEYAKFIINSSNLEEKKDAKEETFGFLVDVSELFEIYLVKLLRLKMPDWEVSHDRENELTVYENNFYSRPMYPDIVMNKDGKVMVFDAKYKRMKFREGSGDGNYGDLDRSDFYQIHSYMSYYNNTSDTLIAGGLLYPMKADIEAAEKTKDKRAHSNSWFGNNDIKFVVDGIDLSCIEDGVNNLSEEEKSNKRMANIVQAEENFIGRIEDISR